MPCELCKEPAVAGINGISLCYKHNINARKAMLEAFKKWLKLQEE